MKFIDIVTLNEVERLGGPGSGGAREGAGRPPGSGRVKSPEEHVAEKYGYKEKQANGPGTMRTPERSEESLISQPFEGMDQVL